MVRAIYFVVLILVGVSASFAMEPWEVGFFSLVLVLIFSLLLICTQTVISAILLLAMGITGIGLLLPAVYRAREEAYRMQCSGHLKHLSLAFYNYADKYRCFPPAIMADKNGKPMHSWRVLILPFLEDTDLYNQYNFNEPWNGPNNRKLLEKKNPYFTCPSEREDSESGTPYTSYLAVIGSEAVLNKQNARKMKVADRFADGMQSSLLLIETTGSNVNWTEPKDLDVDELGFGASVDRLIRPSSLHVRTNGLFYKDTPLVNIAFADSSVYCIPAKFLTDQNLKTIAKIGSFPREYLESEDFQPELHWRNIAASAVWLIAVILLLLFDIEKFGANRSRLALEKIESLH
jgi:hypothetical protein